MTQNPSTKPWGEIENAIAKRLNYVKMGTAKQRQKLGASPATIRIANSAIRQSIFESGYFKLKADQMFNSNPTGNGTFFKKTPEAIKTSIQLGLMHPVPKQQKQPKASKPFRGGFRLKKTMRCPSKNASKTKKYTKKD